MPPSPGASPTSRLSAISCRVLRRGAGRGRINPYQRDPAELEAAVDQAGHARSDASDRRHREELHHRRDQLRGGQPPEDDRYAQGQDRRHRELHSRTGRWRSARPRASSRSSDGARPLGRSIRPCAARARAAHDVSHIHIRYIWPLPSNLGTLLQSYEQHPRAGDEYRPAEDRAARPVSWSTPSRSTKSPANPSGSPRSKHAIDQALA